MARGSIQTSIEWRRTQIEQTRNVTVKYSVVEGVIPLEGTGEAVTTVNFPVQFLEKPVFTFGHELQDNTWPTSGSFPSASASVVSWSMVERDANRRYYAGAEVCLVLEGVDAMRSFLHFHFSGRAFRSPVVDATGTVETI